MGAARDDFLARLARIEAHSLPRGVRWEARERDGKVVTVLVAKRASPGLPWRSLAVILVVAFSSKAMMWSIMGESRYQGLVQDLAMGSAAERGLAWALEPEPVTRVLAQSLTRLNPEAVSGNRPGDRDFGSITFVEAKD